VAQLGRSAVILRCAVSQSVLPGVVQSNCRWTVQSTLGLYRRPLAQVDLGCPWWPSILFLAIESWTTYHTAVAASGFC